jgi:hypothetical protein
MPMGLMEHSTYVAPILWHTKVSPRRYQSRRKWLAEQSLTAQNGEASSKVATRSDQGCEP